MPGLYVDTSALGRVLLAEADAGVILEVLERYDERWSSELLLVELRRLGRIAGLSPAVETALAGVRLLPLDRAQLERASRIEPAVVRSLDAVHLAAAVELRDRGQVSAVLTFDGQLQRGCAHHGLAVESPTVGS